LSRLNGEEIYVDDFIIPDKYDIFPGIQQRKKQLRTEKLGVPDTHEVYANPSVPCAIRIQTRLFWMTRF
jgi:hypothetical protein